jgi:hypothetical protein
MEADKFNMSLRKFLKQVGVTSQQQLENLVREKSLAGQSKLKGGGDQPQPRRRRRNRSQLEARMLPAARITTRRRVETSAHGPLHSVV